MFKLLLIGESTEFNDCSDDIELLRDSSSSRLISELTSLKEKKGGGGEIPGFLFNNFKCCFFGV